MNHVFLPEARAEFEEAAAYYFDSHPKLELRFIDAVENAIQQACDSPEQFRLFDGKTRRVLVHVFPYAVVYVVEHDLLHILAVMHCARKPGYWKQRTL